MTLFKFENGNIKPFRDLYIKVDGMVYTHPSEEFLKSLGYKELTETECNLEYNHETHCACPIYTERENDILQSWEIRENEIM